MYNAQTLKHNQNDVKSVEEEVILVELWDVYIASVTLL